MDSQLVGAITMGMLLGLFLVTVLGLTCFFCIFPEVEERDETALPARAARPAAAMQSEPAARPVQVQEQVQVKVQLPYFPYAAQGRASETLCAICLEPLRQGQLCSEVQVPACRHAFHRDCLDAWAKSKGTCPLCRAKIVPGSVELPVADDMV